MKKETLFLHKNTHHTIPYKKKYFFLSVLFSFFSATLKGVAFRLEKNESWKKYFTAKFRRFCFLVQTFEEITQKNYSLLISFSPLNNLAKQLHHGCPSHGSKYTSELYVNWYNYDRKLLRLWYLSIGGKLSVFCLNGIRVF